MVGAAITRSMEHEAQIQNQMRNQSQILGDSQIKIDDGQRVLNDLCGCPPEKIDNLFYTSDSVAPLADNRKEESNGVIPPAFGSLSEVKEVQELADYVVQGKSKEDFGYEKFKGRWVRDSSKSNSPEEVADALGLGIPGQFALSRSNELLIEPTSRFLCVTHSINNGHLGLMERLPITGEKANSLPGLFYPFRKTQASALGPNEISVEHHWVGNQHRTQSLKVLENNRLEMNVYKGDKLLAKEIFSRFNEEIF